VTLEVTVTTGGGGQEPVIITNEQTIELTNPGQLRRFNLSGPAVAVGTVDIKITVVSTDGAVRIDNVSFSKENTGGGNVENLDFEQGNLENWQTFGVADFSVVSNIPVLGIPSSWENFSARVEPTTFLPVGLERTIEFSGAEYNTWLVDLILESGLSATVELEVTVTTTAGGTPVIVSNSQTVQLSSVGQLEKINMFGPFVSTGTVDIKITISNANGVVRLDNMEFAISF